MSIRLSPMEHLNLVADFVRELHHVDIAVLRRPDAVEEFCIRHVFQPSQGKAAAGNLSQLIADTPYQTILHIVDDFRLHKLLFFVENIPVILGPFCPLVFSQREAGIILEENSMTGTPAMECLSYVSSYPFLPKKSAVNIVRTILHSVYPGEDDRPVKSITAKTVEAETYRKDRARRDHYAIRLEHRHACEKRFREYIVDGNQRAALAELTKMEKDVSYLKRIGSTLENEKIGAAITRTTARLAAMDGGLPSVAADEISNQNTKETMAARTVDEIARAKEHMIRAYCIAVRKYRNESYSVFVQSVLYGIEHNYASDLNLNDIARELAVSKNHLINRFRKEVSVTPMQYLINLRLKHAASLLTECDLRVQDVSSAVGIPDANYFTKLFKRAYGKTPIRYRKDHTL